MQVVFAVALLVSSAGVVFAAGVASTLFRFLTRLHLAARQSIMESRYKVGVSLVNRKRTQRAGTNSQRRS
jgi:hypothetical protein